MPPLIIPMALALCATVVFFCLLLLVVSSLLTASSCVYQSWRFGPCLQGGTSKASDTQRTSGVTAFCCLPAVVDSV